MIFSTLFLKVIVLRKIDFNAIVLEKMSKIGATLQTSDLYAILIKLTLGLVHWIKLLMQKDKKKKKDFIQVLNYKTKKNAEKEQSKLKKIYLEQHRKRQQLNPDRQIGRQNSLSTTTSRHKYSDQLAVTQWSNQFRLEYERSISKQKVVQYQGNIKTKYPKQPYLVIAHNCYKNNQIDKKNTKKEITKQSKTPKILYQKQQRPTPKLQNPQIKNEHISSYKEQKDSMMKVAQPQSANHQIKNTSVIPILQKETDDLRMKIQSMAKDQKLKADPSILNMLREIQSKLTKTLQDRDDQIRKQIRLSRPKTQPNKQFVPLFICNILADEEDYQYFLKDELTHHLGAISRTNFIYCYDGINKSNIHSYIDNKPNLLFIIQTTDDRHIAAFTQSPFIKGSNPKGRAFIFSLTNRRTFPLLPQEKALTYDQHYVIFGNSDLRIKGTEIYSNLGGANGCYESRGERAQVLFGKDGSNLSMIKKLEVFEVVFD